MGDKKFLGPGCAALMSAIVLALIMAPGAWAAGRYKVLHAFKGSDGAQPISSLIFDSAGNLYGTTVEGGRYMLGTAFRLTPNADGSWTESVLHSFSRTDGDSPEAGLIFDAAGNLYGATLAGGAHNSGTVFKLTPNADGSWVESVLHSFNGSDGGLPVAGLIFDAVGNLYGATSEGGSGTECSTNGCGTVFKLTPNADGSWTESVLHSFNGSDGAGPYAGLVFDAAGNLYGTTSKGGSGTECSTNGCGTVFKLTPNADGSWTESVLHSFNNSDGAGPQAGLVFDAAGNIYGTALGGGDATCFTQGCGVIFKLTRNADGSWRESVLHRFRGTPAGSPAASLIFDATGNLYGTAALSGSGDGGAAFKLTPNQNGSWAYGLLHVFQGKPAFNPIGSLVLGSAGTLYGTTSDCNTDTDCAGVVYRIMP